MKRLISILIIYSSFPAIGQDVHFSQFSKSSFLLNPSLTSFQQNDYKATLQRRSQWESVAEPRKWIITNGYISCKWST